MTQFKNRTSLAKPAGLGILFGAVTIAETSCDFILPEQPQLNRVPAKKKYIYAHGPRATRVMSAAVQ
jgi:hypothetical protein